MQILFFFLAVYIAIARTSASNLTGLPLVTQLKVLEETDVPGLAALSMLGKDTQDVVREYIKYKLSTQRKFCDYLLMECATNGHTQLFKIIDSVYRDREYTYVFGHACRHGSIDIVNYLVPFLPPIGFFYGIFEASKGGHVAVVEVFVASLQKRENPTSLYYAVHRSDLVQFYEKIKIQGAASLGQDLDMSDLFLKVWQMVLYRATIIAASHGKIEVVDWFIRNHGINISASSNLAFREAAGHGQVEMMLYIYANLTENGVSCADNDNDAFIKAAAKGHLGALRFLLWLPKKERIDPSAQNNRAYISAASNGHLQVLDLLEGLSTDKGIYPAVQDSIAFCGAARNGHLKVLKHLIGIQKGINPAGNSNRAFVQASRKGFNEVVLYLLEMRRSGYPEINPAVSFNEPFIQAAKNGHLTVLQTLVSVADECGIDPSAQNNAAFVEAATMGHVDVLKYIYSLQNRFPIDVTDQENRAAINSAISGQAHVLEFLATIPGFRFDFGENILFIAAAKHGKIKVLEVLVGLPPSHGIKPGSRDNVAFILAVRYNHVEVVKYMLSLPKEAGVNPNCRNGTAMRFAQEFGYKEIVSLLNAYDIN